jgi:hypothetical protein
VLKPLFEDTCSESSEQQQQQQQQSNNNNNGSGVAFFTAPPPPPPQQPHPAPPFPSPVSPYVIPAESPVDDDLCPPDLGRHQIGLLEKLGESSTAAHGNAFAPAVVSSTLSSAAVVTHTALHFAELVDTGSFAGRKCVFLRLIRRNNNSNNSNNNVDAAELIGQVKRLAVLRDPSIAKVVAMATNLSAGSDDKVAMLGLMTEYLEGGPLPIYLRQYRLGAADNFDPGVKTIRFVLFFEKFHLAGNLKFF